MTKTSRNEYLWNYQVVKALLLITTSEHFCWIFVTLMQVLEVWICIRMVTLIWIKVQSEIWSPSPALRSCFALQLGRWSGLEWFEYFRDIRVIKGTNPICDQKLCLKPEVVRRSQRIMSQIIPRSAVYTDIYLRKTVTSEFAILSSEVEAVVGSNVFSNTEGLKKTISTGNVVFNGRLHDSVTFVDWELANA